MISNREIKRRRLFRSRMLSVIKEIESRDAFKRKPYTVTRMLRWIIYWLTGMNYKNWKARRYTNDDLWDLWEIIKMVERRISRSDK